MSKTFSGKRVIKILTKYFGFVETSQKGSHVKLAKSVAGRTIVTIVALHKELKIGTLKSSLRLGEIDKNEFMKYK